MVQKPPRTSLTAADGVNEPPACQLTVGTEVSLTDEGSQLRQGSLPVSTMHTHTHTHTRTFHFFIQNHYHPTNQVCLQTDYPAFGFSFQTTSTMAVRLGFQTNTTLIFSLF